jgi:hypothetical protein
MNLRVRVVNCACVGDPHWFADIDDADDPQPDDPFWYLDRCPSQAEALKAACAQLTKLTHRIERGDHLTRIHEARLVRA